MLTRSWPRRLALTGIAIVAFVLLYQATAFDSRFVARPAALQEVSATPVAGSQLRYTATAYCKGRVTASGVVVRSGIAAADPALLPVGSVIEVQSAPDKYNGVYTILDTGPAVQGRQIDIYMWNCYEALDFGRRPITLTVLRLGWNPHASSPRLVDRLFQQREAARAAALAVSPEATAVPASDTSGSATASELIR
jgi:3D (Asp-Asp-Asp) domain-containing protein